MRLLILAAAATLAITGAARADEPAPTDGKVVHHRHHNREANASIGAPVAEGAIPADTLSNHDAYMKNLHDSGYNPTGDRDSSGNTRQN
jgi:hypothetical protein